MNELKQKLLGLGVFVDNEYLDLYCTLVFENHGRVKETGRTQRHHIIPRAYFERRNLPVDNSATNLVNLSAVDHIRAHLFLMKSSASKEMRGINAAAVKLTCDTLDLDVIKEQETLLEEAFLAASEAKSTWMREVRKRKKTGWGACRVVCVETGQIYNSIAEAERLTGISISECLRGKFNTAGSYHWKYVDKSTPEHTPKLARFTDKELETLCEKYPTQGANIPELLARHSVNNIYSKAHALGIQKERSISKKQHKLTDSTNRRKPMSEEVRKKISESSKGKIHTEEARKKMSIAHTGKVLSAEHKQKISNALKGRPKIRQEKQNKLEADF